MLYRNSCKQIRCKQIPSHSQKQPSMEERRDTAAKWLAPRWEMDAGQAARTAAWTHMLAGWVWPFPFCSYNKVLTWFSWLCRQNDSKIQMILSTVSFCASIKSNSWFWLIALLSGIFQALISSITQQKYNSEIPLYPQSLHKHLTPKCLYILYHIYSVLRKARLLHEAGSYY